MSNRQRNEDLFEDTRMSFGQHIEELRKCLVRALYGLAIACIIGFMYADSIVSYLQRPLETAIREYDLNRAKAELIEKTGYADPELDVHIEKSQLAPRTILVSNEQLVATAQNNPELAKQVELSGLEVVNNSGVKIAKFLHQPQSHKVEDTRKKLKAIAAQLNDEEKSTIASLASKSKLTEDDDLQIQQMLSRITSETRLYEHSAFDDLTEEEKQGWLTRMFSSGEIKTLPIIKKKLVEAELRDELLERKLNRKLISLVFPNELSAPRANLVPLEIWEPIKVETQSLTPHEPFMIWMKAGFFAALVISSPWILYQLWTFVWAGLYPHEKRYVHWYLPISVVLFFAGVSLAFFFVLTPVLNFLFNFNASMGIAPQLRINYWLSFVMYLPIGFGVAFQLPLVMLVLNRLGIFEIGVYLAKWRVAIMVIFIISMFLTPADPLSMVLLAVPLTILYFFGIALCKWMPRNRNPFGEVYEPA